MIEFECVGGVRHNLAEGPVWSPREQVLYWVNIREPAVYRYDPASRDVGSWRMPDLVGSLAVCERGGLLVALRGSLARFAPASGQVEPLVPIEPEFPEHRCNDGKCDRRGRFWVGTMNNTARGDRAGSLYRFDGDRNLTKVGDRIEIPNGLAWSPDDRTMYFTDTFDRQIFAYDFDADSGAIGAQRSFAKFADGAGTPDGATVDAEGFLWTAVYGGGRLHRYAPDGRLDRVVPLPMTQPTSCAFGGHRLDVLYVTSASQRLTPEALAREPYAGAVIAADVGVRGIAEPAFAG
jgi:sugar lactone lactonase YvrE